MKNKKGFTLIEIIVVVVILAVLLAVAVPSVLKYLNEADSAKFLATSRAINEEVSIYVNKRLISDARENIPIDQTVKLLGEELRDGVTKLNEIVTTTPPKGYKISSIICCFDGVNVVEKIVDGKAVYVGWGYDKSLKTHQLSKIVIWYTDDSYNSKFVVTLLNKQMYFYDGIAEAIKAEGKEEGPFILH